MAENKTEEKKGEDQKATPALLDTKNTAAEATPEPEKAPEPETKEVEVDLYNANDGLHGRPNGGPYLDQEEMLHWEKIYAAQEGKKPDLEHPRGYPGVVLQPLQQQVDGYNPTIIAGDEYKDRADIDAPVITTTVQEVPVTEE